MNYRYIISTARVLSLIFRPFFMPLASFTALFTFTYLDMLPAAYKLSVSFLVYLFTILMPQSLIFFYRKVNGWNILQLRFRERRSVPYLLSIISYSAGLYTLNRLHMPHYMGGILVSSLMVQVTCAVINTRWKICIHSASAGGLTGVLIAFSILLMFNPVWWLCLTIFISGIVGTCRMVLRQHSLAQILAGTLVGVVCGCAGILLT